MKSSIAKTSRTVVIIKHARLSQINLGQSIRPLLVSFKQMKKTVLIFLFWKI